MGPAELSESNIREMLEKMPSAEPSMSPSLAGSRISLHVCIRGRRRFSRVIPFFAAMLRSPGFDIDEEFVIKNMGKWKCLSSVEPVCRLAGAEMCAVHVWS